MNDETVSQHTEEIKPQYFESQGCGGQYTLLTNKPKLRKNQEKVDKRPGEERTAF